MIVSMLFYALCFNLLIDHLILIVTYIFRTLMAKDERINLLSFTGSTPVSLFIKTQFIFVDFRLLKMSYSMYFYAFLLFNLILKEKSIIDFGMQSGLEAAKQCLCLQGSKTKAFQILICLFLITKWRSSPILSIFTLTVQD